MFQPVVSVHQGYLRLLMTEIFKRKSQINSKFLRSYFTDKDMYYSLRKGTTLDLPKTHSFYYGTKAVHFQCSLIWNKLHGVVKSSNSLFEFRNRIENIGNNDCGCLICRDI